MVICLVGCWFSEQHLRSPWNVFHQFGVCLNDKNGLSFNHVCWSIHMYFVQSSYLHVKDLTQAWELYYHMFRRISKQLPLVSNPLHHHYIMSVYITTSSLYTCTYITTSVYPSLLHYWHHCTCCYIIAITVGSFVGVSLNLHSLQSYCTIYHYIVCSLLYCVSVMQC